MDAFLDEKYEYEELTAEEQLQRFMEEHTLKQADGNEDNGYWKGPYYHGDALDYQFIVNEKPTKIKITEQKIIKKGVLE